MILTISGNRDISEYGQKIITRKCYEIITSEKFDKIYIGGARGVDNFALQTILSMNYLNKPEIIIVVPFQLNDQPSETRELSRRADKLIEMKLNRKIKDWFNRAAYQTRNIYMIEKSTNLIAFTANESGGTQNAINFGKKINIDVEIVSLKE